MKVNKVALDDTPPETVDRAQFNDVLGRMLARPPLTKAAIKKRNAKKSRKASSGR